MRVNPKDMAYQSAQIVSQETFAGVTIEYDANTGRTYFVINNVRVWSVDGTGTVRMLNEIKEGVTP